MNLLRSLFEFLNRDLTRKTWIVRRKHPYFGDMTYFASKEPSAGYWEAELAAPGQPGRISVTMGGTSAGPLPSEEEFCKTVLSDLDALFDRCRPVFEPAFNGLVRRSLPLAWRESFSLDGFEVPSNGDSSGAWHACFFNEESGRYLTARFLDGGACGVEVDG